MVNDSLFVINSAKWSISKSENKLKAKNSSENPNKGIGNIPRIWRVETIQTVAGKQI